MKLGFQKLSTSGYYGIGNAAVRDEARLADLSGALTVVQARRTFDERCRTLNAAACHS